MTTFGSIIDTESAVATLGAADLPIRPALIPDASAQLTSPMKKPRPIDDEDAEALADRWNNSVHRAFSKAFSLSEKLPSSMTVQARLADAALLAGESERAIEAAISTLQMAQGRHKGNDASGELDVPAAYVALQVLLRLGKESLAEQYLPQMVSIPLVAQRWASILVAQSRLEDAVDVLAALDFNEVPGVASLYGYILVLQQSYARAITYLRAAQRLNANDVDAALNLAVAFWNLGSPKKAIRWARYATRVTPGRSDATMALLHYLVEAHEFESAASEVRALIARGMIETPPLLLVQAQIAAGRGQLTRVSPLLRRARALADEARDSLLVAELDGQIAVFRYVQDEIDRLEALQRVRSALRRAPSSPMLVAILADLIDKSSAAGEVRRALEVVDSNISPSIVKGARCRLAFLEGRFDDACKLALKWARDDPNNERALRLSTFWYGALCEDWEGAADRALKAIERLGTTKALANATAYALALAGRGHEAIRILDRVDTSDFVLKATAGLVYISIGELSKGLSLYRRAAQQADRRKGSHHIRCFMTVHQAMGLRRLGVTETGHELVRAGALPGVDLPSNWQDIPDLRFLAEVARRRGWHWPVTVD